MNEITIHAFENSEGDFQYDIHKDKSPEQIAESIDQPDDGGCCTSDMNNALDMAREQTFGKLQNDSTKKKYIAIINGFGCGECEIVYKDEEEKEFEKDKHGEYENKDWNDCGDVHNFIIVEAKSEAEAKKQAEQDIQTKYTMGGGDTQKALLYVGNIYQLA